MGQSNRRRFLIASGALLIAELARAQPAAPRKIGFLGINESSHPSAQYFRKSVTESLARLGYVEGKNLLIDWRYADGQLDRLPALADELVRAKVEVILTPTNAATAVAKKATQSIPIVMLTSAHPVASGFIESHARPGGNITGLDWWPTIELWAKTYQMAKLAVPGAKTVATLWDPDDTSTKAYTEEFSRRITTIGFARNVDARVRKESELDLAPDLVVAGKPDVMIVAGSAAVVSQYPRIAAFSIKHRLVSIAGNILYPNVGGLLSYGPNPEAAWDRAASYVDRILRGAKPADLPVEQPTKYELVLNVKTAKEMDLKLPPSFMAQVDRVIE